MYIKNNKGSRIDPCGTPQMIIFVDEDSLIDICQWNSFRSTF